MISWITTRVGRKMALPAAIVLVVGAIFWFLIQYGENTQVRKQEVEELQNHLETMEKIDEAIRTTPAGTDAARGVLDDFLDANR